MNFLLIIRFKIENFLKMFYNISISLFRECDIVPKTIFNLILIAIICSLASFIPLNSSYVDFSKNFFENLLPRQTSTEIETIISSYEASVSDTLLYNPTNIEFTMIGDFDKGTFSLSNSHDMVLEVFSDGNLIKSYVNTDFVTGVIDTHSAENMQSYSFDISQENLKLYGGPYKFSIYSTADIFKDIEPYELTVSYLSNSKYVSSEDIVDDGYLYLTLYFIDEDFQYLVPVSRKIKSDDYSIRFVLDNLELGPKPSMALMEASPVPNAPRIWVSQGLASLHLPRNLGEYEQGSSVSLFAVNSFVNTLTSLDVINSVKFLSEGREVETLFHGIDVTQPFKRNNSPKVYLGLETSAERFLLAPIDILKNDMSVDSLVPILFESLKNSTINGNVHESLTSTVPESVNLLNHKYDKGILTLNLSKDFLSVYSQRIDMKDMMLESILYTFTSIPDVSMVAIEVEGNKVPEFNGVNLSVPMSAPKFINIEEN